MTETKILGFINSIKNINQANLQLKSANCAPFARLLKKIFPEGEFVAIVGSLEPEMVYHIMLKINDKYYDSEGEWTEEEIIKTYKKINRLQIMAGEETEIEKYEILKIDEDDTENLTESTMELDELISKLEFK